MPSFGDTLTTLAFGDPNGQKAPGDVTAGIGAGVVFGSGAQTVTGPFGSSAARRHLEAYAGGRNAIRWVMICCNVIGRIAAGADWYLETADGKKLDPHRTEHTEDYARIAPPDLVALLERPNPWLKWSDLIKLTIISWKLAGESFWLKWQPGEAETEEANRPLAIYWLNPSLIEVVPGDGELVKSYRYRVPGKEPVDFDPDDVVHIKEPNPHSPFRGAGIIAGDPRVFDMAIALTETKAQYFEQGARLSGVLETDRNVGVDDQKKIRQQFFGLYSGSANSYKVAVLGRGLHFKPIQSTAAEAEFSTLSKASRDDVFAMFTMPKSIAGIEQENRAAQGQAAEDRREFANSTMRPLLDDLQEEISIQLTLPGWGLRFCIEYEYTMPIEDQIQLATNYATLPGIKIDEVRKFAGLPPLGGPQGEIVLNLPGANDNSSTVKDRPLGSEPGRPPNGENTAAVPADGKLPADAQAQGGQ